MDRTEVIAGVAGDLNAAEKAVDEAIIRATTADERGNLTYEHEGAYLGGLEQAICVRTHGGLVIAGRFGDTIEGLLPPSNYGVALAADSGGGGKSPTAHAELDFMSSYGPALERAKRPGDTVFEIGTGSGIVAMMAARAGAGRVVTCEVLPVMADAAREIVELNGLSDLITVINKKSTHRLSGDIKSFSTLACASGTTARSTSAE